METAAAAAVVVGVDVPEGFGAEDVARDVHNVEVDVLTRLARSEHPWTAMGGAPGRGVGLRSAKTRTMSEMARTTLSHR